MTNLSNKRIIISGLVSAKVDLDNLLSKARDFIDNQNGLLIGEFIQRRGVSRSRKPGGVKMLDLPLNSRTVISSGKLKELVVMSQNLNTDLILFINSITSFQHQNLEKQLGLPVLSIDFVNLNS